MPTQSQPFSPKSDEAGSSGAAAAPKPFSTVEAISSDDLTGIPQSDVQHHQEMWARYSPVQEGVQYQACVLSTSPVALLTWHQSHSTQTQHARHSLLKLRYMPVVFSLRICKLREGHARILHDRHAGRMLLCAVVCCAVQSPPVPRPHSSKLPAQSRC